jgi:hypothetical protein
MAQKRRSSQRRPQRRPSGPAYVAPVLDPTWQSPYSATTDERDGRENALRRLAVRQATIGGVVGALAATVAVIAGYWIVSLAAVALSALFAVVVLQRSARQVDGALDLAASLITRFEVGGTPNDRLRLSTIVERLSATFGLDSVACMVVSDPAPNATLLVDRNGYSLLVTTGMMDNAELIELEGVVAHCMARQRLGYLQLSAATAAHANATPVSRLFDRLCPDYAFRADEVAAVTIRYPVGLAGALRRCEAATVPSGSYFTSEAFRAERVVWFDPYVDGRDAADGERNVAGVRAAALEEW